MTIKSTRKWGDNLILGPQPIHGKYEELLPDTAS
jgi:hypothetical protein